MAERGGAGGNRSSDWGMDFIVDKSYAILVLLECGIDLTSMERLKEGKKAKVAWRLLLPYKGKGLKSIATDDGSEFAGHE